MAATNPKAAEGDGYDVIDATGDDTGADIIELFHTGNAFDFTWAFDATNLTIGLYGFGSVDGALTLQDFRLGSSSVQYMQADIDANDFYTDPFNNNNDGLARVVFNATQTATDQGGYTELMIGTESADVMSADGGYRDYVYGAGDRLQPGWRERHRRSRNPCGFHRAR